jgi:hypothetical protein
MAIDYDTSALPKGTIGWTSLLSAVENAHQNDENQWIEFKASLDPTTVDGRFTVAKAIVAFANRDPDVAAKWLTGHAVIIIGLEPGNLAGAREVDPADLHNSINQLLAAPAPAWDPTPLTYKGKHVLVITVDPPRQGDPIACIGKNSGDAIDGHVYVRKQGKSERATSADIRRLSARLLDADRTINGISIEPGIGPIPVIDYPNTWLADWLFAEERRLLAPLDPPPASRPATDAELRAYGINKKMLAEYSAQAEKAAAMAAALGTVTHEESRTEDEYRVEVADYLDNCRISLTDAFEDLRSTAAAEITLTITNRTNQNYEQTFVELHFDGDVYGYEYDAEFTDLHDYLPKPPRPWGPWTENRLLAGMRMPDLGSLYSPHASFDTLRSVERGPSPTINNGGSVTVNCVPLHLYPSSRTELITLRLVAKAPFVEPVTATWTATASNVNGKTKGSFSIPVGGAPVDMAEVLQHQDP